MKALVGAAVRQPLGPASATTLERLTRGLAVPGQFGLMYREVGDASKGAPTVGTEYVDSCNVRVTRYVELEGVRTDDPELNDRVADPQVEFFRSGGAWYPVAASSELRSIDELDVFTVAETMLRDVALEHDLSALGDMRAPLARLTASFWATASKLVRRALS